MELGVAPLDSARQTTPGMMLKQKLVAGIEDLLVRRTNLRCGEISLAEDIER